METIIKMEEICKSFGENHVIKNLNLTIHKGEFLTLLGPSGCGKTTALRMLAGFEYPTSGTIYMEGNKIQDTEPYNREANTVFQNYALFPHMTIFENIAFGLGIKKVPKEEIKQRVTEMLELVQLVGYELRKPNQLSGGQKQRVAIARALINRPKLLLLDEPLGALDLKLRKQMQFELKGLQKKLGITFVYVTHDQEEALTMSDRIAIMHGGVLEQLGTPHEIYETPASKFVADFIGESNLFYGTVGMKTNEKVQYNLETGGFFGKDRSMLQDEIVDISVRPENIKWSLEPVENFELWGIMKECVYIGNVHKLIIELPNGKEIRLNQNPKAQIPTCGSRIFIYWDEEDAVILLSQSSYIYNAIDNPKFEE